MASIYNDVVSSRRGSSAVPRCHSRFAPSSSWGWITALRVLGTHSLCQRDEPQGQLTRHVWISSFGSSHLLLEVTSSMVPEGKHTHKPRVALTARHIGWKHECSCEGRDEHGCKALVQGKGRCKQERERFGDRQTLARCLGQEIKRQSVRNREKQHQADTSSCLN